MEITHESLLKAGFLPVPNRPYRYEYQGFRGVLIPQIGLFSFEGLTHDIAYMADLKFLLMLIDHKNEPSRMYPVSDN